MEGFGLEARIYDYMVCYYLLRVLEHDEGGLRHLKLARCWGDLADRIIDAALRELTSTKNILLNQGCRIVMEEMTSGKNAHIMYVHRRYEYHCYMMPHVLKARCEEKFRQLLSSFGKSNVSQ